MKLGTTNIKCSWWASNRTMFTLITASEHSSLSFRVGTRDLLCPKGEDKILYEGNFKNSALI